MIEDFLIEFEKVLGNNILEYCYCGSGKKYNNCCKLNKNNFLNLEIINNFDSKSKDLTSLITQEIVDIYWKDIVGKHSNKDTLCLFRGCKEIAKESHLFGNKYLQKNIDKKINITRPLSKKDIEEVQSPVSLKTKLFCNTHDRLFNITDHIQNFGEVINDNKKIDNFILKTIFFEFKYSSLNMRLLLSDMNTSKNINKFLDNYLCVYKVYNLVCGKIDDFYKNNLVNYRILCKCNCSRDSDENNVFYSKIVTKNSCHFFISLVHDNSGLYIIIASLSYNIPDFILNEIKNNLEEYSKLGSKFIEKFLENYFELNSPKNRIGFIYGNELVDIGLKV